MRQFAGQVAVIGEQQYPDAVFVETSDRIHPFGAGSFDQIHHRFVRMRVFDRRYEAFRLVHQDVYFLFPLDDFAVEAHFVLRVHFRSEFGDDLAVDRHNAGRDQVVRFAARADARIGDETVQADSALRFGSVVARIIFFPVFFESGVVGSRPTGAVASIPFFTETAFAVAVFLETRTLAVRLRFVAPLRFVRTRRPVVLAPRPVFAFGPVVFTVAFVFVEPVGSVVAVEPVILVVAVAVALRSVFAFEPVVFAVTVVFVEPVAAIFAVVAVVPVGSVFRFPVGTVVPIAGAAFQPVVFREIGVERAALFVAAAVVRIVRRRPVRFGRTADARAFVFRERRQRVFPVRRTSRIFPIEGVPGTVAAGRIPVSAFPVFRIEWFHAMK